MEKQVIVDSSYTAIINAPIEKVDIAKWAFNVLIFVMINSPYVLSITYNHNCIVRIN